MYFKGERTTNKPLFNKGDNVKIIGSGRIGTVNEILIRESGFAYRVTIDGKVSAYPEKYLALSVDEEQEIIEDFFVKEKGNFNDFRLFQTWFRLKRPVEGNYYSYLSSKTIFNPFQFKPLRKFIAPTSEDRLFIADEVGVGKTIETGIILTELVARGVIDRKSGGLVVCPNSLGPKWVKEMKDRFNFSFHLHDSSSLKNYLHSIKADHIPEGMTWSIVSLSLIRSKNHSKNLQEIAASKAGTIWSMIIIDESHHMRNPTTESYDIGVILSEMTEMMLMLSATPLNLRDEDLFHQMYILNSAMFPDYDTFTEMLSPVKSINHARRILSKNDPSQFSEVLIAVKQLKSGPLGDIIRAHPGILELESRLGNKEKITNDEIARFTRLLISLSPFDKIYTRTLKREALDHRVTRETIKVPITLTEEEMAFFIDVLEVTKQSYLERGGDPAALGFVMNVPARMVTSCIPAMKDYLKWCVDFGREEIYQGAIHDAEEEIDDDQGYETTELSPRLKKEYQRLLIEAENLEAVDTKYSEFSILLEQLFGSLENKQVMVFAFFVRTLKYLKKRLEREGYRVGLICGDVPTNPGEGEISRYEIIQKFEDKEYDVLLSSEVGGEGLDFQFCQAIINYDLPYNPMRIEQRIGRIDRFGQNSDKVFIASMYLRDTVDERIYTVLYDRIKLVEDSVGNLEPIIGTELADLRDEIIKGNLSPEQIEIRTREIEQAIENAKLELEQFEKNRYDYLGEDYFTTIIQDIGQKNEFIQPFDALWLTNYCFSLWKGCQFEPVDKDRGVMTVSKEVLSDLERYTRLPGSEGCMNELSPLLKGKFPKEVVFNGSIAIQYTNAIFLPPSGFWIRFILDKVEREREIVKTCVLSIDNSTLNLDSGWYIVPIFEIEIEGFTKELALAMVPLSIVSGEPVNTDYKQFSRTLMGVAGNANTEFRNEIDINKFIDKAREALEKQIEKELEDLKSENEYMIQTRKMSTERAMETRIGNLETQIDQHLTNRKKIGKEPNEWFINIQNRQIENLRVKTRERILISKNGGTLISPFG